MKTLVEKIEAYEATKRGTPETHSDALNELMDALAAVPGRGVIHGGVEYRLYRFRGRDCLGMGPAVPIAADLDTEAARAAPAVAAG